MFEFIRAHQLNLMLILCGGCAVIDFLLIFTRFLSKSRKTILMLMVTMAFFLLWFDRMAYIYAGDLSRTGYIMVRVSNFIVFFLTPGLALGLNLYISDWLTHEGKLDSIPVVLRIISWTSVIGMCLAVYSAFTDLYYYFDETNHYHRGNGFLIAYIIPVICPLMQFFVARKYRKTFGNLIYISIVLYVFVPVICGITQVFTYGISIVNMSMVAVSISMYIFMYLDMNEKIKHAHEIEIRSMQVETDRMQRLFDQTATAFVSAVEKKDEYTKGNAIRTAQYARKIAERAGMSREETEKAYYAALLHDVGLIGISDEAIKNETDYENGMSDEMKQKPLIGEEILSSITEYPYLMQVARYSRERFDGSGYPEGLKGEEIPKIARIIAVADDYVSMTTRKRYRDELPKFVAREMFLKESGEKYDSVFADIMVKIIDSESNEDTKRDDRIFETGILCRDYREHISTGIPVESKVKKISFVGRSTATAERFGEPSIVLFDSSDGRTHKDAKSIEGFHYLEYGEIWFDEHSTTTAARCIEENRTDGVTYSGDGVLRYEIIAGRYEDHLKLVMRTHEYSKEVIVALPSQSNEAYIGITGENFCISDISVEQTGDIIESGDIRRIAPTLSYIDHLESDIRNVQIDRWMSDSTEGVEVTGKLWIAFHTMSLPGANLIWHCPYIVLFYSDDGRIGGPGYREYNIIKLNGEDQGDEEFAKNSFVMKKGLSFPGWDKWKEINKEGLEVEVYLEKKGDCVMFRTDNLGIAIENMTTVMDDKHKVYVALSGDQVALTDIRIN
ncbi:MAG: HD domain-containing protein [Lachnospiraceae bacterium]|nr:HD domain-containing protein [Lachnospiraceae bacterium]